MYVCMYVCVCVCVYVCMYVCMYVWMYACMHVWMYGCMDYGCMHACMHVCFFLKVRLLLFGCRLGPAWHPLRRSRLGWSFPQSFRHLRVACPVVDLQIGWGSWPVPAADADHELGGLGCCHRLVDHRSCQSGAVWEWVHLRVA